MTLLINDTAPRRQYTAEDGQVLFAVPFEFFANADLEVWQNEALLPSPAYTVVGAGVTGGGSVTLLTGALQGDIITIVRNMDIERLTDFPPSGPFNIAALNAELDAIVAMIQQLDVKLEQRALMLSVWDTPQDLFDLPPMPGRAQSILGFDAEGQPVSFPSTELGSVAIVAQRRELVATAGQTTFQTNATYTVGYIGVYVNGVRLSEQEFTATDGVNVVLDEPCLAGDVVLLEGFLGSPTAGDAGSIMFLQAGAGAVTRTAQDKMRESVSLADFGAVGDGVHDDTAAINAALALGGIIDTVHGIYRIKSRLLPALGTHLIGHGTFLADPAFSDAAYGDGLTMMLRLVSNLAVDRGITFDGNSITTAGFWISGCRNVGAVSKVTLDCTFKNLSFNGIDVSRNNGAWANADVTVRGHVENVGWTGANLEGVTALNHDDLSVIRTGWHGIYVGYCLNVAGDGFYVNKAAPPYRIYDGAGSYGGVEKGFLFSHFSVTIANWTEFLLYDNRNAGFDGFGIGEDGSLADPESANIYAQGQIWYAGLFGFDASSDLLADLQIWYPAYQGVQLGFDLGGTLGNVDITAQVYNNLNDEAVRFSASGTAPRTVAITNGSPNATIVSGSGFFVASGQRITGTGIPAGTTVVSVAGNAIVMSANATATNAAAALTFRGVTNFANIKVDVRVANCIYGVGIESGADGYTTYADCEVRGDLSSVSAASVRFLNGIYPAGMAVKASRYMTAGQSVNVNFAAAGHDTFNVNGGTLNKITNGYPGQEITCFVNASDLIIHPNWGGSDGNGENGLIGNANVNVTVKAGGMFKAKFRQGVGWYFYAVTQVTP